MAYFLRGLNKYWKNDCDAVIASPSTKTSLINHIRSSGDKVDGRTNIAELRRLVRLQHHHTNYKAFTRQELKTSAVQRGLISADDLQGYQSPSGQKLAELLLTADQEGTFPRFMGLPAEIRVMVEEFYVAGLQKGMILMNKSPPLSQTSANSCTLVSAGEALFSPAQPPLARTSKMMRKEVLPLFYCNCDFAISFSTFIAGPTRGSELIFLDNKSTAFLNSLAPGDMANIKQLLVLIGHTTKTHVTISDYPALRDVVKGNAENCESKEDVAKAMLDLGKCFSPFTP
jgi:hypothetical protein